MAHDLSPDAVAARLDTLRRSWIPEDERSVRSRFDPPQASTPAPAFEQAVALRLAELRALLELTDHLHRARLSSNDPR